MGAWQGGFGARIKPPVTLGHEFVGEVAEIRVGERPSLFKVGDRIVGEPIISCGQCPDCRTGNYNVCKNIKAYGIDTNGCFAQYVRVPLERLHHVPEDLPTEKAVLCEPLAVAVHMRRVAGIEAHHRVAIFGAGPIGQLVGIACRDAGVTQLAAVDINPYRLELARESGMTPFNAAEDGFKEGLADFFQGRGADVSFEVAAAESTIQAALEITGIRGTILMGGFFKKPPTTDLRQVILKELSVRGSRMYNFLDFDRTLRLLRRNRWGWSGWSRAHCPWTGPSGTGSNGSRPTPTS